MGRLLFSTVNANFFFCTESLICLMPIKIKKYIPPLPRYFVITHESLVIKVLKHTICTPANHGKTKPKLAMATRSADVRRDSL